MLGRFKVYALVSCKYTFCSDSHWQTIYFESGGRDGFPVMAVSTVEHAAVGAGKKAIILLS